MTTVHISGGQLHPIRSPLQVEAGCCLSCQDLKPGHSVITILKLYEGISSGCKACALLKDFVNHFRPVEEVREIAVVVDCALYIHIFSEDKSTSPLIIELYTDIGKLLILPFIYKCLRRFRKAGVLAEHRSSEDPIPGGQLERVPGFGTALVARLPGQAPFLQNGHGNNSSYPSH